MRYVAEKPLCGTGAKEQKFLLLFSKRSLFFCSFLKKRTKKLLFPGASPDQPVDTGDVGNASSLTERQSGVT
jgi:hypothetical protein